MSKQRRRTLGSAMALVALGLVVTGAADGGHRLKEVRVAESAAGDPIVTLVTSGEATYESFVIDGPDRLVIDLHDTIYTLDNHRFPVHREGVNQVRAAQHELQPAATTRVVIDLEQPVAYRIAQDGGELKVLFGGEAVDPTVYTLPVAAADAPIVEEPVVAGVDGAEVGVAEPESISELIAELEARNDAPEPTPAPAPEADGPEPLALDRIDQLLKTPALAAPAPAPQRQSNVIPSSFESRRIVTDQVAYSGKRITLNLVDADIKQVFRLFHEISGINFVLDPGVSGRVTIVLDQVPWDQALDIILKNNGLDKVLENNVLRIATTKKLAQEAAERKQLKDAKELEVEPITLTRTLSYARAEDVERVIREGGVLTQRGRVIVDTRTNTLIISDVPKRVGPLDQLINTLDSETPQVVIEARIVETTRTFSQDLGVVWGFSAVADASTGTNTGLAFPNNAAARYALNLPGDGGASNLAFNFSNIIDSFTLDVALNTLESEGKTRILSSPKIATQNNEQAEIEQGVRIPIVNTTATEIDVEFVSASLRLLVTPQITAEGTIILDVEVENNSPDFVQTAADIPSIRTQRAQTKVLIADGGTTVIGGIFTTNEGQSENGVPWFRKLPVFGWLFKTSNVTIENRELLIFITPKIVKLG